MKEVGCEYRAELIAVVVTGACRASAVGSRIASEIPGLDRTSRPKTPWGLFVGEIVPMSLALNNGRRIGPTRAWLVLPEPTFGSALALRILG